jgi:hypothetical protein
VEHLVTLEVMIVLDVKGNLAFIGIGFTILGLSMSERLMMRL